jgi:hypothetical protein
MSAPETPPARPAPGTRLLFRWRKWDGSPHWRSSRPERDYLVESPNVTLLPPSGLYAMTVNVAPPATYRIYIDIGWDVRWMPGDDGPEPAGIDMDLDVVSAVDGRGIWIDDRDEWDEHRIAYGYPLDIVEKLEGVAVDLERSVRAGVAPFDDATPDAWLERLAALEAPQPRLDA